MAAMKEKGHGDVELSDEDEEETSQSVKLDSQEIATALNSISPPEAKRESGPFSHTPHSSWMMRHMFQESKLLQTLERSHRKLNNAIPRFEQIIT